MDKKEVLSNEREIREATRIWITQNYPSTIIRDEFTQNHLPIRNDLFAVCNKYVISIEIKSNKDNFSRLEKQVIGYKGFSNTVIVALDECHLSSYLKRFSNSELFYGVGLLVFNKNGLSQHIRARTNEYPMMYDMLWSSELQLFFSGLKLRSKIKKSSREAKYYINRMFTYQEIYEISKYIFTNRISINGLTSLLSNELQEIILTKQEIFTKLIQE